MRKLSYTILSILFFIVSCSKDDISIPHDKNNGDTASGDSIVEKEYQFPDEFTASLVGKSVRIKNSLVVASTFYNTIYNNIVLSNDTLFSPTDIALPNSPGYYLAVNSNKKNKLNIITNKFKVYDDNTLTLRVGACISNLKGKVYYSNNQYTLSLEQQPKIDGNERPLPPDVGRCNLKVCSMNLEFYLPFSSAWGSGYGPSSQLEYTKQHNKILSAMIQINADIFPVCEMQEGDYGPKYLVDALNKATNSITNKYKYIDTDDSKESTYTKVSFIYNSEKVSTYKSLMSYGTGYYKLRHIAQCFELKSNNARVIIAMNHYKSKRSNGASGADKDKNDGQGSYNALRLEEAKEGISFYKQAVEYYGDDDVLVLGDLNSYSFEDPIREFINNGYVNELKKFSPRKWSYVYNGEVGNLDQSISSSSLSTQITGVSPWIVNAGEPVYFGYKNTTYSKDDPYRYSDHNPIITGLMLK